MTRRPLKISSMRCVNTLIRFDSFLAEPLYAPVDNHSHERNEEKENRANQCQLERNRQEQAAKDQNHAEV